MHYTVPTDASDLFPPGVEVYCNAAGQVIAMHFYGMPDALHPADNRAIPN